MYTNNYLIKFDKLRTLSLITINFDFNFLDNLHRFKTLDFPKYNVYTLL